MRSLLWPDCPRDEHLAEIESCFNNLTDLGQALPHDRAAYSPNPHTGTLATFVAENVDGGLVGFVELSLRSSAEGCTTHPVGYIEGWYVDADARRSGIGRALVAAAEAWAVEQGCQEMASDTELDNTISQLAHEQLGYEEVESVVLFDAPHHLATTIKKSTW